MFLDATVATLVGVVVTIALTYGALLVLLLVTAGIPLGAEAHSPGALEYAVMLVASAAAAAIGAKTTLRLANRQSQTAIRLLAVALPLLMVWGFFGSSGWPRWWGPALAAAMVAGVLAVGRKSSGERV